MKKMTIYKYLGTNGVVETPVHLEGIYYVRLLYLTADDGKILSNGKVKEKVIKIPEEEFNNWIEIEDLGQN